MIEKKNIWTREQLIVALNLYWKIPYNKISGSSNIKIKDVSNFINRTPAALAYKLMNFTSLDPERQGRGNKGKSAAGLNDRYIWDEYFGQWEKLALDSSIILSKMQNKTLEDIVDFRVEELKNIAGREKERLVKTRVNQNDFRQRILASYNEKCCITGLNIKTLLVASHIIPWSKSEKERLNPHNGLCLNSIHDRAFDKGLITITNDFKIKLSDIILANRKDANLQKFFFAHENQTIILPDRFIPSIEFLEYHQTMIFNKY